MILALETSTPVCSVALGKPSGSIIEKRIEGKGVHSDRTFTFIHDLLDRHDIGVEDLDAVLFSNGPGSYTGLRIGAAAVKGILFQRNVPLYTLSTLLGFAAPNLNRYPVRIHAVIDARRNHLYYQKVEMITDEKPEISDAEVREIKSLENEIRSGDIIIGTGWNRLALEKKLHITKLGTASISAKNLIIGWNQPFIKPFFLKQDVATFEPDYLTMSQVNNSSFRG